MLGSLGSGAQGEVPGGKGAKMSLGNFYIMRGCMNQTSPENCQIPGKSEQNSTAWTQRLGIVDCEQLTLQKAPSYMLEISYCNPLTLQRCGTSDPDLLPCVHREGVGAQ